MPKPLRPYYSRGRVRLYWGDCLEVLPRLGRRFDLVLTDPPYRFKSVGGGGFRAKIYTDKKFLTMAEFDPAPFVAAALGRQRVPNIVAMCSRDLIYDYARLAHERGLKFDPHAWHKPNAIPFTSGTFKADLEYLALIYGPGRPWQKGQPQRTYSKLFTHNTLRKKVHVTQKPLELMRRYLTILCPPGGRVLDPFAGSATTLAAAAELGLGAVGIEHDKRMCRVAAERLEASR